MDCEAFVWPSFVWRLLPLPWPPWPPWPPWTAKDRCRSRAAAKRSSPAWEAVTAQVPTAIAVTVSPETVHTEGVSERKDTTSPEVADADRVPDWPTTAARGCAKAIACGVFPTTTLPRWTGKDRDIPW